MKVRDRFSDSRVKQKGFSWIYLLSIFFVLMLLALGQSFIIVNYFDSNIIPSRLLWFLAIYWGSISILFCLLTTMKIRKRYEALLKHMGEVTRLVAEGDFSAKMEVYHDDDNLDYLDAIFMDFNKMVDELSSIEILKNDFVSNVSHEIKTPLAVIQNYATLLQDDSLTREQRKEYTGIIFNASEQFSTLVTNILRLNKLENQTIQPVPKAYDVCSQLSDCIITLADQLESKEIDFSAETEDKAMVLADEGLVEIIWNNLLSNAIKFTKPGGKIMLTQTSDDNYVTVSIQDTGCGMTAETMRHVFDKFYQGDPSHLQKGNGLGLALVKRVIELIHGEITMESQPNRGSTFTVKMQRAKDEEKG